MLRIPTLINFSLLVFWKNKIQEDEESTALLIPEETFVKHHGSITNYDDIFFQDDQKINMSSFLKHHQVRDELTAILKFAIPLVITFLLGMGNRVVDTWFLGKIGSEGNMCMIFICSTTP